jgi:hypothetical protein
MGNERVKKAFISYSSQQQQQVDDALKIKEFLESIYIDSFVAKDDLRAASTWKDKIVEELKNCDLFIPLLSKEFKESEWCSQEMGIAYIQGKKCIPISLDDTKPYGFINHIQTRFVDDMFPELILSEGLMECEADFRGFIQLAKTAPNFRRAEEIFKTIDPYFTKINKGDLNLIVKSSIENSQIWSAADCAGKYLPKLLELRQNDIEPDLYAKLIYQCKNGKWYPEKK